MFLIFDTETTGLPKNYKAPLTDSDNWPRLVQLAWQMHDKTGALIEVKNFIVRPDGFEIPFNAEKVHGISTQKALNEGLDLKYVLDEFTKSLLQASHVAGHNVEFDLSIVGAEYYRIYDENILEGKPYICTKETSTEFCALPGGKGGKYKWPNLSELHQKLFHSSFEEAHNAAADVVATARCFLELIRLNVIPAEALGMTANEKQEFKEHNPDTIQPVDIEIESHWDKPENETEEIIKEEINEGKGLDVPFTHLHVHTQYSILDGAASIPGLVEKAKADGMVALAITDHGSMFGVKEFHNITTKNNIKPVIGCEMYVARRTIYDKADKTDASGDHLVLLAKNYTGYKNLLNLISTGYIDGMYYKPRIDKNMLKENHEGIIALSACLGGELPRTIMDRSLDDAGRVIEEFKSIFGDDYYLELQRHKSGDPKMDADVYERQVFVNQKLIELGKKHDVKCVATNDVHFINAEDAGAHDRLVCLSTQSDLDDENRLRYTRQEWFKTQQEMHDLFADIPDVLANTFEVVNKVEEYKLNSPPILPIFPLPEGFTDENEYLKHLTYKGAEEHWSEITEDIKERIDFELETIKKMGFPGYFLIVQDFIAAARSMNVSVGPGRGSAAGSAVAYCLKITDIDPIKYNLLFERFLNPDRISMPDIDIDFDEDGRDKVLRWVVDKYGKNRVAHIITFGTMAARMAIRDVARIEKLPLQEADRLAKLVPERPGTTLKDAYKESPELIHALNHGDETVKQVLKYAETLEGSVRHTGLHACGIIIGKNDLKDHIPLCTSKDSDLYVTQYDGKHIEDVGMLKMDFLGLKTLSIIKDAVENIKLSKGVDVDIDNITLEDTETYELYARGETTGLFQFESAGMKKYLKELKPNKFEDLIAMNALYRPGPMDYIPSFVNRKHGKEKINYDLPEMEEHLQETYGITVYQEQVMLLSRVLAGFSRGEADSLRKAMGKKKMDIMNKLKVKFDEGCEANGHDKKVTDKIWEDWKAFAQYAFNKSHSTCYAYVSYQTAYLKAHYPAEFMAAVLSRNINDIKKITIFMDECRRMGMQVLGPDVNESYYKFTVNKDGNIRFGLGAIKGVGEAAVLDIINERKKQGSFKDIYDFAERINLQSVNKKNMEALATAGAFDNISSINRSSFFSIDDKEVTFVENLMRYGSRIQSEKNNAQKSLFGDITEENIVRPVSNGNSEWTTLEKLNKEKELIGIYLSAHPLDNYKLEMDHFCTHHLSDMHELRELNGKDVIVAGIVTSVRHSFTKNNKPFGSMTIEDYTDSYIITFFGKDYMSFKNFMTQGYSLLIKGSIQPRFGNQNELELKVNTIHLLTEVRDEMIRNISIIVPSADVSEELVNEFKMLTEDEEGKVRLKFKIFDPEEKIGVEMFSRNKKINLSNEFIEFLESYPAIEYKMS